MSFDLRVGDVCRSSRAHTVFILSIEQTKHSYDDKSTKEASLARKSKFFFADLGRLISRFDCCHRLSLLPLRLS